MFKAAYFLFAKIFMDEEVFLARDTRIEATKAGAQRYQRKMSDDSGVIGFHKRVQSGTARAIAHPAAKVVERYLRIREAIELPQDGLFFHRRQGATHDAQIKHAAWHPALIRHFDSG